MFLEAFVINFLSTASFKDTLFCVNSSPFHEKLSALFFSLCLQMESGQGDLGTLANVVTSLANLSDSLKENLNNGDTSDSQHEEQSASDITRSVSSA